MNQLEAVGVVIRLRKGKALVKVHESGASYEEKGRLIEAAAGEGIEAGSRVRVAFPDLSGWRLHLPHLIMLGGAIGGTAFGALIPRIGFITASLDRIGGPIFGPIFKSGDNVAMICGPLGVLAAWFAVDFMARKNESNGAAPRIIEVLPPE